MARDNGGIIGPVNDPTNTSASGVWSLEEQYQAQLAGNWPSPPAEFSTNSLRFDDGSSDYLKRTPPGAGDSNRIFTISLWFKRANLTGAEQYLFECNETADNNDNFRVIIGSGENLVIQDTEANVSNLDLRTNRLFRDISAWYHLVLEVDTTQATSSDRAKLYINGVQETSFSTSTYPSQNYDTNVSQSGEPFTIGRRESIATPTSYFNGYLSEVIFIDGQALDATSFGVSDANGVWTPIKYEGIFGTNGFQLQFGNAAALGTDSSPNGNDFTVNNLTSIDQTTDYPVNNFATLNSLSSRSGNGTFSEGNTKFVGTMDGDWTIGTIAVSSGKWYWEVKANEANFVLLGITTTDQIQALPTSSAGNYFIGFRNTDNFYNFGTLVTSSYSYTDGDIFSFMLDLDAGDCEFYQNDTLKQTITLPTDKGDTWIPIIGDTFDVTDGNYNVNFGNPSVTISSGNSDANGYGNFEYTTKTGYALCTKNLAEYG